jgi:hypothetical protein
MLVAALVSMGRSTVGITDRDLKAFADELALALRGAGSAMGKGFETTPADGAVARDQAWWNDVFHVVTIAIQNVDCPGCR